MRRRDFLTMSISATGALCPAITIAQPGDRIRRIGVLVPFAANDAVFRQFETAFVDGLARLGWIEGRNIRIDYRHAAGNPTLFQTYAAELVGHGPDTILASTLPAVAALQQQTHTVPIVFVLMPDPVGLGFVQSLAHPGGNLTGLARTIRRCSRNGSNF